MSAVVVKCLCVGNVTHLLCLLEVEGFSWNTIKQYFHVVEIDHLEVLVQSSPQYFEFNFCTIHDKITNSF